MKIINKKVVQVFTRVELTNVLEFDNGYDYIYLGSDITLENGIYINDNKIKVTINGTYDGNRYKLIGMNSNEVLDCITVGENTSEVMVKNIDIEYTNTYGVIYVPPLSQYSSVVVTYDNIKFNGTQLSYNPFGTTKITDSIITIEKTNEVDSQEVCESDRVILGGNTTITSSSTSSPLFIFRSDTASPSVIFLCQSRINISTDTKEFMHGTNKLNFTILHDTEVNIVTGNGFSVYTYHGANNVLIDERASLNFIEKNHQRVPMWSVFGNFTMREGSKLYLINSYDNTPSDNYNIYFKGDNPNLILDNPKEVVIYTKNANVIYTINALNFKINCSRVNMWSGAVSLTSAGGIDNLPDFSWYKEDAILKLEGVFTVNLTAITNHNLTSEELNKLPNISNFSFLSRKQFSIGDIPTNIHVINTTNNSISGHTTSFADVLIKYSGVEEIVSADEDGLFEYQASNRIENGTEIEFVTNVPNSFMYKTRKITTPHDGELSLLDTDTTVTFDLVTISSNPFILAKKDSLLIKVVDSRLNSSAWKLYAYINKSPTSQFGYVLDDALIFKKFDDEIVVLDQTPKLVFTGTDNGGVALKTTVTCSKEKGPLLDLSNNYLEINEEYFADIYFQIEE